MAVDSPNPQMAVPEQGLTTSELSARRRGVGEEETTLPPEIQPLEEE